MAFISVENYTQVGVGSDIESAMRTYQQVLSSKGNQFVPGNEMTPIKLQGKISRVSTVVKNGESYFYFMLEGDNRIFVGTAATSPRLPLVQIGDIVTVQANSSNDTTIPIHLFKGENY